MAALTAIVSCGKTESVLQYVNPFVGNADYGHTHPCATVPFGMVQVGPESGNNSWDYTAGYQYRDSVLYGFSQNRLNGTGCPDMGDLLMFPFCTDLKEYKSSYKKDSQSATPGYYQVYLDDSGVHAEMTATEHVALHHYTFDDPLAARLMIDFQSAIVGSQEDFERHVKDSRQDFDSPRSISGWTHTSVWVDRTYRYEIEFSHPYVKHTALPLRDPQEKAPRYLLEFDLEGSKDLLVKVSISLNSTEAARNNILAELPEWDFPSVKKAAQEKWAKQLSSITIEGTKEQKDIFYTCLYHLFQQPNDVADFGQDPLFSTFSLWDTYRAAHPLYTIIAPEVVNPLINSMLKINDRQGFLPIWSLWGLENYCMIGNHAVPVIVDAFLKGFNGFDAERAYQAIRHTLTQAQLPKTNWTLYDQYGYFPLDLVPEENVSRTMECCYDDWCAAQMALKLGHQEDYAFFMKRSGYWKNVVDQSEGLVRGKDSKGQWRTPFDKFYISHAGDAGGDYTEGNAWQYSWHVQHDVPGMIEAFGGPETFMSKLDSLYTIDVAAQNSGFSLDVTGLIGQYAHGNEPSHHVSYLYALAGNPAKTQELIRKICTTQYNDDVNGLCGNDDCGQMSAWYIFACLGFYPVNPCGGEFIIGAPQLPFMSISLPEGKTFQVRANGLSETAMHVKEVRLNGKVLTEGRITYEEIMSGGLLEFDMI